MSADHDRIRQQLGWDLAKARREARPQPPAKPQPQRTQDEIDRALLDGVVIGYGLK